MLAHASLAQLFESAEMSIHFIPRLPERGTGAYCTHSHPAPDTPGLSLYRFPQDPANLPYAEFPTMQSYPSKQRPQTINYFSKEI